MPDVDRGQTTESGTNTGNGRGAGPRNQDSGGGAPGDGPPNPGTTGGTPPRRNTSPTEGGSPTGPQGNHTSTSVSAPTEPYASPTGGLVGYYGGKMNSTGMSPNEWNALQSSTLVPIQQQQQQATEAMMRVRAATGNDAGIYGGISELARNAANQTSQQGRQNVLTNADVARKEQAEGAAGNLNLYGQTQAETMEYLRMLGNLLGRQTGTTSEGSTSGVTGGIAWNPGGSQM